MSQVIGRTGWAGEMEHVIHRTVNLHRLGDVVPHEPEAGIVRQMVDVPPASRQQIVNAEHLVPFREESLAKMRPDEAGPPSDDGSQGTPPDMTRD
jgi:hypothetical protein